MKIMISKELVTNKSGKDFFVELHKGDVFTSFHEHEGACFGFYIKKAELRKSALANLLNSVTELIAVEKLINSEVKVIADESSSKIVEDYLLEKDFTNIKKIVKEGTVEVMFLPEISKVRVSKDSTTAPAKPVRRTSKYKVLVVDDSKTIRNILSKIFSSDPGFEVCAMAEKPSEVESLILKHKPDVITLDIHMPEMDGVTLLKKIAPKYHIPTIMISSISMAEGPLVLEALENGAVDYIQKPELSEIANVTPLILEKVRTAVDANLSKKSSRRNARSPQTKEKCDLTSLIVLGSSTGGTEAIRDIITALPNNIPPMLIVQHIPAVFSAAFAKRMNDLCPFEVKEAEDGDEVRTNRILVAPGGKQMKLVYKAGRATVEINDDEPVNRFKPSVDYLFYSVAKNLFTHTVAVILTGMGKDGAKGMLELKKLGAKTIAQDEFSSVVFGMPKEAIAIGAVDYVEPLQDIAERIALLTNEKSLAKKSG